MPRPKKIVAETKKAVAEIEEVVAETSPTPEIDAGEEKGEEMVQVSVADLQAIVERQKTMEGEIEILRTASNRARLERADEKAGKGPDKRPQGHLKKLHGKIVLSWKSHKDSEVVRQNQVIYQGADIVGELVKFHAVLLDKDTTGKHEEMIVDYKEFSQSTEIVHFRVNSIRAEGEETYWMCEFEDPAIAEQYGPFEVNIKYVNP